MTFAGFHFACGGGGKVARKTRNRSAIARQIAVSDRHLDHAVRNGELDQQLTQASKLATARKPKAGGVITR